MRTDARWRAWAALDLGPRWVPRVERVPQVAAPVAGPDDPALDPALEAGVAPALDALRETVAACRRCGLCETRRRTVFGSGPSDARWLLIGEAPGAEEDASGEPFVGQAGRLLDRMLAAIDVDRPREAFITNVLKCRPPGNRNPEPAEVEACSTYLRAQIGLLRPVLIVLLGRFAAQTVLNSDATIGSLRGRVHAYEVDGRRIPVVCTYHPAYLLRNLPDKRKSWEDLCLARETFDRFAGAAGAA